MNRIAVVGATGSGKTTLAKIIAHKLGLPHIEIDSLYWGPNWTPFPLDDFRLRIDIVTRDANWVMDGNYSKVRDLVWGRADALIWLDYPYPLVFWQLLKRSISRIFTRVELWNNNHETFHGMFLSRDSLFVWLLKSYRRQKSAYPALIKEPMFSHLVFIRLKSPRETEAWVNQLPVVGTQPS